MSSRVSYNKFIVSHSWGNNNTNDEYRSGNAFIFPNHYSHSLSSYKQMVKVIRKEWPELNLKDEDFECLTVINSQWCKGMPIIRFTVPPDSVKEGWRNCENQMPDVGWG